MVIILIAATGIKIYPLVMAAVWAANCFAYKLHGEPSCPLVVIVDSNGFGEHGLNVGALMLLLNSRNQYRAWLNKVAENGEEMGCVAEGYIVE